MISFLLILGFFVLFPLALGVKLGGEVILRIYPRKYKNTEKYKVRSKREKIEDMVRFTHK